MRDQDRKVLLVVAYKKKRNNYVSIWQIINKDGSVIRNYASRKVALRAYKEIQSSTNEG